MGSGRPTRYVAKMASDPQDLVGNRRQLLEIGMLAVFGACVVFGAVRDVEVLATMPVAVRALGVIPVQPHKKGAGERDVPVRFAGVRFTPGDWLYADENGLLVSPRPLE